MTRIKVDIVGCWRRLAKPLGRWQLLPKAEHSTAEWQAAMEALMLVATLGGPTMMARIGMLRALNRHVERVFYLDRKDHHWGRRKLARDR
jgi:hypothetical protein